MVMLGATSKPSKSCVEAKLLATVTPGKVLHVRVGASNPMHYRWAAAI